MISFRMNKYIISASVEDIANDIRSTSDLIRKTILKRILELKMIQQRALNDDPSLSDLSRSYDISNNNIVIDHDVLVKSDKLVKKSVDTTMHNKESIKTPVCAPNTNKSNIIANKSNTNKKNAKSELQRILIQQNKGLAELAKVERINTYMKILDNDKVEKDQQIILSGRNSKKAQWEGEEIYDPRYAKYQKDDTMNNKLMERLNSEIDFRTDDDKKCKLLKPFGDDTGEDIADEYARYVPLKEVSKQTKYGAKTPNRLKNNISHHNR